MTSFAVVKRFGEGSLLSGENFVAPRNVLKMLGFHLFSASNLIFLQNSMIPGRHSRESASAFAGMTAGEIEAFRNFVAAATAD